MPTVSTFAKQFGPWVLVTGASSGIGEEFVRQLAAEGFNVVLAARRGNLLQAVAQDVERRYGITTKCVVIDLSQVAAIDTLDEQLRDIDIGLVVSNAGNGHPGHFLEQDHREQLERFRLNALSHFNIARIFCERFAKRGGGGLLFGGAMGAAHGIPFAATDAGAKALVQSLGESLHLELKRKNIQVMTLVVPPTNTAIITRFGMDPAEMPMKPMSTEQCVSEALRHFKRGRSLSLPGKANRFLTSIIPDRLMRVMMGKMIEQTLAKNAKRAAAAAR
jgi:short-subunit dehydrogenase